MIFCRRCFSFLFALFVTITITPVLYSQNIDSLSSLIPSKQGKEKVDILIEYCNAIGETDIFPEAEMIIHISDSLDYPFGLMMGYRYLGNEYYFLDDIPKADSTSLLSLAYAKSVGDHKSLAEAYVLRAGILNSMDSIPESYDASLKILHHAKLEKSDIHLVEGHFALSELYYIVGNKSLEFEHLLKALRIVEKSEIPKIQFSVTEPYLNGAVALAYEKKGLIDSAFYHYHRAFDLFMTYDLINLDSIDLALLNLDYGKFLISQKEFEKSKKYCNTALEINKVFKSPSRISYCYLCLAQTYADLNQLSQAKIFRDSAIHLANQIRDDQLNYEIALFDSKQLIDSLPSEEQKTIENFISLQAKHYSSLNQSKLIAFKGQLELDKREEQMKLKNQQIAIQSKLNMVLFFTTLLLILLLLVGLNHRRTYKKLQKELFKSLELQKEHQRIKIESLSKELINAEKSLIAKLIWFSEQSKMLKRLRKSISALKADNKITFAEDLSKLENRINRELIQIESIDDFMIHFEKIHPDFFKSLLSKFPALNPQDLRLLAYIKLNMSTKEIARILNISPSSANTARYRLRKKMNLAPEEDLNQIILSV